MTDVAARVAGDPASASRRPGAIRQRVRLLAVTKGHGTEAVEAAVAAGVLDVGESYAQELLAKVDAVEAPVRWHFIGGLQRNKVRSIAPFVQLWQSVDRLSLAGGDRPPRAGRRRAGAGERERTGAPGRLPAGAPRRRWWTGARTWASRCGA